MLKKTVKDSAKKLAVRRYLMGKLRDLQEVKPFAEKKADFFRTLCVLGRDFVEKLFHQRVLNVRRPLFKVRLLFYDIIYLIKTKGDFENGKQERLLWP